MLFIPSRSRHAQPLPSLQGHQDHHCRGTKTITAGAPRPSLQGYQDHHCRGTKTITAGAPRPSLQGYQDHHCRGTKTITAGVPRPSLQGHQDHHCRGTKTITAGAPRPSLQGHQDQSWDSGNLSASSLISPAGDVAKDVLDGLVFRGFPAGKAQLGHHRHQEPAHLPLVPTQQLRRFSLKKRKQMCVHNLLATSSKQ